MTAIAATDITLTKQFLRISGKRKRYYFKMTFGDGALTYPSGGIPMPAPGKFGMVRNLEYLLFADSDDSLGIIWKYDKDNNKLRGYRQGVTTGATAAAVNENGALVTNENGTEATAPRLPKTAASTSYDLGKLQELSTGYLVVAHTMYVEAVGW